MFYYGIKKISFSDKRMPNLECSIESLWGRIEHLGRLLYIQSLVFLCRKKPPFVEVSRRREG